MTATSHASFARGGLFGKTVVCCLVLVFLATAQRVVAQDPTLSADPSPDPLTQSITAAVSRVPSFKSVTVSAGAGVVTLTGEVESASASEAVAGMARSFEGVKYVDNRLAIVKGEEAAAGEPENTSALDDERLQVRLDTIFEQVEEFAKIEISVRSGVVHLEGEVSSRRDLDKAVKLAQRLPGVIFVDSDLSESFNVVTRLTPTATAVLQTVRRLVYSLPLLLLAVLIVGVFFLASGRVARVSLSFGVLKRNGLLRSVVRRALRFAVILVGVFFALELLDATSIVAAILGTAGVVGLALSFAFRDIVENYLASIILSVRNPFLTHDYVEVDGVTGKVVRLTTSETVLMTADGNSVRIPNATVFKSRITNYTRNPLRRFDFAVGVGADEDLARAQQIGVDALKELPGVLGDPAPSCLVEELGDSAVNLRFFGWVDQTQSEFLKVKSHAIKLLKTLMDLNEVDLPVPTYAVDIRRGKITERTKGSERGADPKAAAKRRGALADARQADVAVDRDLEAQIEKELRATDEDNLLDAAATSKSKDVPVVG